MDVNGTNLFFSPSGISSSSRSNRRCSSTDHAILNVSDLGPRERLGFPFSIFTSFSASLPLGGVLHRGDRGGLDAFRDERLSATAITWGRHGVGVDESAVSNVCGDFEGSTSMNAGLTNALSTWEVVLQTSRSAGKRRRPDSMGQRCGVVTE